ncbi:aldehyde dehydrogenase family protein [Amycolatopsis jejuensis]|uniref:aldehyde dehydrogenase family protein n=1 Tax=Amycolatopsis jejuensis TaxID=330084 RepID=UPI0007C4C34A|nr:aldehyde dehydrogenase family protein [Amycolatopsis jejuensis]
MTQQLQRPQDRTLPDGDLVIGGEHRASSSGETFDVFNPSTGAKLCSVAKGTAGDVDAAVRSARAAFAGWRETTPLERGRILARAGRMLAERQAEFADVECRDAGKPKRQAVVDTVVAARYFEYYSGYADKLHGRTIPLGPDFLDYTVLEPHGVCGVITPWNYPLAIACRSLVPALAVGNSVVFKPAEDAPLTGLMLVDLLHEAGLPAGVLNVVPGLGTEAGAALVEHPDVDHISFTGSVPVGQRVMAECAKHLRPLTLELGGKSPHIVFADADFDKALPVIMNSIFQHAGQTCTAGSRLLVQESVYDKWVAAAKAHAAKLVVGDASEDLDLGALINEAQQTRVAGFVDQARESGVTVETGGRRPDGLAGGWYYEPTVLSNVDPLSPIAQEEVFGPVLTVIPFRDAEHAVELANCTEYGLAAGVWSSDVDTCVRTAAQVRAGQVYVNNFGAGGGVELPTGGFGKSGFGREKGLEALLSFTSVKNVSLRLG